MSFVKEHQVKLILEKYGMIEIMEEHLSTTNRVWHHVRLLYNYPNYGGNVYNASSRHTLMDALLDIYNDLYQDIMKEVQSIIDDGYDHKQ